MVISYYMQLLAPGGEDEVGLARNIFFSHLTPSIGRRVQKAYVYVCLVVYLVYPLLSASRARALDADGT